jgi:hypothetical protein
VALRICITELVGKPVALRICIREPPVEISVELPAFVSENFRCCPQYFDVNIGVISSNSQRPHTAENIVLMKCTILLTQFSLL